MGKVARLEIPERASSFPFLSCFFPFSSLSFPLSRVSYTYKTFALVANFAAYIFHPIVSVFRANWQMESNNKEIFVENVCQQRGAFIACAQQRTYQS